MRRQKYGSANLKYVKVKRERSGRVVARNMTEMISKEILALRVFNLRNDVSNNNTNKILIVKFLIFLEQCFRIKAIIKILMI